MGENRSGMVSPWVTAKHGLLPVGLRYGGRGDPKEPADAGLLCDHRSVTEQPAGYFAMSLSPLSGRTLMTLRAGLALNICSFLVKGLMPL